MTKAHIKSTGAHRKKTAVIIKLPEKLAVLFCAVSLTAAYRDIYLAALPLVFLLLCRERLSRYICALLSVLCFAATVVTGSFYIPYMAFVFVYIIAEYTLPKNSRYAVCLGVVTFVAVKSYLLSMGYSYLYWTVMVLETAAFFLLPSAVKAGAKLLRESTEIITSLQLAECAAALIVAALSLTGIKIWGVNIPVCFLMCCCFFYSARDNMPLSLLSVIVALLFLWKDDYFSLIYAGFLVIGFASFALMKKGHAGLFATFAVAFGITIAFISQFNSFIFITTTSVALTGCFILTKCTVPKQKCMATQTTGENDYLRLLGNVDRLGRTFRFLGHTVMDISELLTKETVPADVQEIVAKEVCRKCGENHICWQENYSDTQKQFSVCEKAVKNRTKVTFDPLFLSRCSRTEKIMESFEAAQKLVSAQQLISQAGRHSQQILQNQFLTMAQTLQDIVYRSGRSGIANTAFTHTISNFLSSMGKKVNYCICYQNNNRCIVNTSDCFTADETEKIKTKLESVYGARFELPVREDDSEGVLYTFCESAEYTTESAYKSKSLYSVCGDICEEFESEEYRYIILADGMGTGSFASAESRTAVAMLKQLLKAGTNPITAIEIANIALNLKGTGQSCVALDILQIDCYSGKSVLYTAGGAAAMVISRAKYRTLYKDSLPIGVLKDIRTGQTEFELENGDCVVMMSDGVKTDRTLRQKIALMAEKCTAEEMAEYIISLQSSADDATAAVIKLVRM